MAGEMNADIILAGVDTTHPTTIIPFGTSLQQAADTLNTQAQTGQIKQNTQLTSLDVQAKQLQLQQAQIQMQGAAAYAQAAAKVAARYQAGNPPPSSPAATDTTSPAPNAAPPGIAATDPNSQALATPPAASQSSPDSTGVLPNGTPASIALPIPTPAISAPTAGTKAVAMSPDPDAPAGTTSVLPKGVDPKWSVNFTTDWYQDADGNPISHYTGPAITPSGRVNLHSAVVQNQIADEMTKNGADPAFVAQMRMQGEEKAQEIDKENVDLYKGLAETAAHKAAAAESQAKVQQQIHEHLADTADYDLSQPNPQAAFLQTVAQNPTMWNGILKTAVKPGDAPITDANDPRILPILKGLQSQSPEYLARQKVAIDQQNADQGGVHVLPAYTDDYGNTVPAQVVKVADGTMTTLGSGGRSASPGSAPVASSATMTPDQNAAAAKFNPGIRALGDSIARGDTPMPKGGNKNDQIVANYVATVHPEYAQNGGDSIYSAKQQAIKAISAGGKYADNVNAAGTAFNHLADYEEAAKAVNNGDLSIINKFKQQYGLKTGDTNQVVLNTIAKAAGDEVAKVYAGVSGGGEADRQKAEEAMQATGSYDQQMAAAGTLRNLMLGKLYTLHSSVTGSLPKSMQTAGSADDIFNDKLTPEVKDALTTYTSNRAQMRNGQTNVSPAAVDANGVAAKRVYGGSPASAAATTPTIAPGQFVDGGDGHIYVWNGRGSASDRSNYTMVK